MPFLLRPLARAKYCNQFVCLSVTIAVYIMYIICTDQSRAIIRVILSCRGG